MVRRPFTFPNHYSFYNDPLDMTQEHRNTKIAWYYSYTIHHTIQSSKLVNFYETHFLPTPRKSGGAAKGQRRV